MYKIVKRTADIFVALLAIMILLPLLLPILIILKCTGEGEIFYKQDRVGFKNQIFMIWKFATMLKNSPNMGTGDITLRNDPRVTPAGNFLRKTKLNELPQLVNILKGDMSFVGPRPLMPRGFEDFPEDLKYKVYDATPGLTGAGSVLFRDEELILTQSGLPPREAYKQIVQPYKAKLEIWYQQNQSLYVDFMLLFLTVWVVIFPTSDLMFKVFKNLPKKQF
ncbi:MAG: sugar transferase [Chitinophagaceae bacterium]